MQAIFKVIIILGGLGALITGQALLGMALLALGIAVIIAVRPAEKALAPEPATDTTTEDTTTEDTSATTQAAAVGYTALLLVLAVVALAFIINGVIPGGSGLLR